MAIKKEALDSHFSGRAKEKSIATNFDEAFDIVFGTVKDEMSLWFALPSNRTRERFGFQKEVLVIYCPYSKTDARVLRTIDTVLKTREYANRIEKVIFILVHNGDKRETTELFANNLDRIIIPIQSEDILNAKRGTFFLRNIISEYLGQFDLFGVSSPINSEKYFFGRDTLVQALLTRVHGSNQSAGLFGLRKTGKTSVLKALQRRTEAKTSLVEYIDCANPGVHSCRWWQLLENIVLRLIDSCRLNYSKTLAINPSYSKASSGLRFSSDIKLIISSLSIERLTVLFDEIEFITPELSGAFGQHWDNDFVPFWQTIRSVVQETDGKFNFIVTGVNPASVENPYFKSAQNPIFQLAKPHYLEPFDLSAVKSMCKTIGRYCGLNFEPGVYEFLQEKYGGHPFLIRIACSEVLKNNNNNHPEKVISIAVESFQAVDKQILGRLSQPFKDIILSLIWWYPDEYELLHMLSSGDSEFVAEYINDNPNIVARFENYGITKGRFDSLQFAIADLKEFVFKNGNSFKQAVSPFIRGDVPLELLPEVPDLDILGALFTKRAKVEVALRRVVLMYLGMGSNWDETIIASKMLKGLNKLKDRPEPKNLFVSMKPAQVANELYTNDLKSIITANWDMFQTLFENNKVRFEMNMDTINTARNLEAHTKPIEPADVDNFNNSYDWLYSKILKVPG
ncbi:hypothetical protein [Hymenobacter cheonanensis]|uniref:hypothetical protein n=1 Tax=Hymenobacter sp. CA2-7 TaxID=3063993 RepID=UPI002713BEE9|nr:hypothetical protein [Hymenobacter sp. CA2-7]MDO7884199.1 hypothetical protein [Hymenobacter sp. CA2-7]